MKSSSSGSARVASRKTSLERSKTCLKAQTSIDGAPKRRLRGSVTAWRRPCGRREAAAPAARTSGRSVVRGRRRRPVPGRPAAAVGLSHRRDARASDVVGHLSEQGLDRVEPHACRGAGRAGREPRARRRGRGRRGRGRRPRPDAPTRRTSGWCRCSPRPAGGCRRRGQGAGVDTIGGHGCVPRDGEVRGRVAELATAVVAMDDGALDAVRAAERLGRGLDVSLGDALPDERRRPGHPVVAGEPTPSTRSRASRRAPPGSRASRPRGARTGSCSRHDGLSVQGVDEDERTNSSGVSRGEGREKCRTRTPAAPAAVEQLGAVGHRREHGRVRAGRTTSAGCGSNVTTTTGSGRPPCSAPILPAAARARSRITRWPRWTPSKTPIVTTEGPRSEGTWRPPATRRSRREASHAGGSRMRR